MPVNTAGYSAQKAPSVDPRVAWRVELPDSVSKYEEAWMFVTEHGSTIAIKEDEDIISVCAYKNAKGESVDSTRALLEFATKNGGDRFDSFSGNYGVYRRCGFEPVSHIEFNEEYAPPGWVKKEINQKMLSSLSTLVKKFIMQNLMSFWKSLSP